MSRVDVVAHDRVFCRVLDRGPCPCPGRDLFYHLTRPGRGAGGHASSPFPSSPPLHLDPCLYRVRGRGFASRDGVVSVAPGCRRLEGSRLFGTVICGHRCCGRRICLGNGRGRFLFFGIRLGFRLDETGASGGGDRVHLRP